MVSSKKTLAQAPALEHNAERLRLAEAHQHTKPWYSWGPYLSERQWGTVREDYFLSGNVWDFFLHDYARSCTYCWGAEGGLKCHRPFKVAAAHFGRPNRVDGPVSRLLVQQSGEDRWPIEAGETQPVNRTRVVDQRG